MARGWPSHWHMCIVPASSRSWLSTQSVMTIGQRRQRMSGRGWEMRAGMASKSSKLPWRTAWRMIETRLDEQWARRGFCERCKGPTGGQCLDMEYLRACRLDVLVAVWRWPELRRCGHPENSMHTRCGSPWISPANNPTRRGDGFDKGNGTRGFASSRLLPTTTVFRLAPVARVEHGFWVRPRSCAINGI